ncbi:MAG: hypothetical protein AAF517_26080, partial [Planctomycetota bacterium]
MSETLEVFDVTVDSTFHNFVADNVLVHNKSTPIEGPMDYSDFQSFQLRRVEPPDSGPSGEFCPPVDEVFRADIERRSEIYSIRMEVLVEVHDADGDCLLSLGSSCFGTEEIRRDLTADEVTA